MRITCSTPSANAIPVPSAQAAAAGSSFHAVLADASTDRRAESRPTGVVVKDERLDEPAEHSIGAKAAVASDATVADEEGAKTVGANTQDEVATAVNSMPCASTVTVAPAATGAPGTVGLTLGQTIASSGEAYSQKGAVAGPVRGDDALKAGVAVAPDAAADNGTVHPAVKQERARVQADVKASGLSATASVPVVDSAKTEPVTAPGSEGSGRGSDELGSLGKTAANAASEIKAKAQGKAPTPVDETSSDSAHAVNGPDSVASPQTGVIVETPAELTTAILANMLLAGGTSPASINAADSIQAVDKSAGKGNGLADALGIPNVRSSASGVQAGLAVAVDSAGHAGANGGQATQGAGEAFSKMPAGVNVQATEAMSAAGTVQTSAREAGGSEHASPGAADTLHTAKAENLPVSANVEVPGTAEASGSSGINSAKIMQTLGESEMHVGMHSEEFGDISIRTSLSQQQMVTQISLSHSDLGQAISTHLSNVQAKLGEEYGLHASIEVNHQGAPLSSGQGDSRQQDQQMYTRSGAGSGVVAAEQSEGSASVVVLSSTGSGHGLDIRV